MQIDVSSNTRESGGSVSAWDYNARQEANIQFQDNDPWITPYSKISAFPEFCDMTIEQKVRIFEEQVLGWQLDIADACINGKEIQGSDYGPIKHSGYAALSIILSYFEMIEKWKDGYCCVSLSEKYFKQGVRDVCERYINAFEFDNHSHAEEVIKLLYSSARCGLYHTGAISSRIRLLGSNTPSLHYNHQNRVLYINPHALIKDMRQHFENYILSLRIEGNNELRSRFVARFNYLLTYDPLPPVIE